MPPVIDAKDLYKRYPGFAPVLKGAGIQVEAGEMAAIMGPSGCGKSTMLHILGMLHAPDSGSLKILDTDVLALNREQTAEFRRENMGFVMQASNLFDHSTVFENVEFPLIYNNIPEQERWERVIRALDLVHLTKRVHYRSNQLSGGEQQRVAIARAMVNNPGILMADEPTGALDAKTSRLIMENFQKLCHGGGVSMIMVTHDPNMAEYCDSIYTLEDGQLKCQKKVPTPYIAGKDNDFAKAPEPVVRGALIVGSFPTKKDNFFIRIAGRLFRGQLLSGIFSVKGEPFLEGQKNYTLPLGVNHMGFWQKLGALFGFLFHGRGYSPLWRFWRQIPGSKNYGFWRKALAFSCGNILARWAKRDHTEFIYAASATKLALPAWVCARLTGRPFAFSVSAEALPFFSPVWEVLVNDSAFVSCTDKSVLNSLERQLPKIPKDKFLLLRPVPQILPEENEDNFSPVPGQEKKLEILCMGPQVSAHGFRLTLEIAQKLKSQKTDFHLTVIGRPSLWQRLVTRSRDLTGYIDYAFARTESGLAELYHNADIFIAYPPVYRGSELALPDYVCSAMAFGLCIIVVDMTPGMAEALDPEKNSVLLPSDKALTIAETIAHLQKSPKRMEELGKAARESYNNLMNFTGQMKVLSDQMAMASALADRQIEEKAEKQKGNKS